MTVLCRVWLCSLDSALWRDPITQDRLKSPVLASDGVTYSRAALVVAMGHDPLHRSPVTGEVLRPLAIRNTVVEPFVHADDDADDAHEDEVLLWQEGQEATATAAPGAAQPSPLVLQCTFRLPVQPSPETADVLLRLGLDSVVGRDCSVLAFQMQALPTGASMVLVHPPPPEELWDTCVALAGALHIRATFRNPWCLSGAVVLLADTRDGRLPPRRLGTVESLWLQAVAAGAAARHEQSQGRSRGPPAPPRP